MKRIGIAGFLLSFAIISYVLYHVGIDELVMIINNANILYVGAAMSIYILTSILNAIRWNEFILDMKMRIKFVFVYIITWIGFAINSVTPIAISGGEPAKIYFLSKFSAEKKSRTMATVAATGFLEFGSFVLVDVLAVIILYFKLELPVIYLYPLLFMIVIGTLLVGSMIYASLNKKASMSVTLFFTSMFKKLGVFGKHIMRFEENLEHNIHTYSTALREVSNKTIVSALSISVLLRANDVFRLYVIVAAFGVAIDPVFVLIAIAFATVASILPLLPGSIGAIEPAMIAGLMLGGLSLPIATAAVIVDRLIVLGSNLLIGFGSMYALGFHVPPVYR